ncbi:MAG: T9SS type A sorting domain-containing protein [Bacteroidota bacterium]
MNTELYLPNSMQGLSIATQYFYAIGQTQDEAGDKNWSFLGVDWNTGEEKIRVDLAPHADSRFNTKGSGIQIGPFGDVITMSLDMILRFRKWAPVVGVQAPASTEDKLKIFPNPTHDVLNVRLDGECFDFDLFDLNGRNLLHYGEIDVTVQIDVSTLSAGSYWGRIRIPKTGVVIMRSLVKI